MSRRKAQSVDHAFQLYAQPEGECIVWTGSTRAGYGRVSTPQGRRQAHRVSYERSVGPVPEGMEIDHICFNKACIKPQHLRPVTRKQNMEHKPGAYANSQSGVRGVHPYKGRWKGEVNHNKKAYLAGYFDSVEEAAEAVRLKRLELFTHSDVDKTEEPCLIG